MATATASAQTTSDTVRFTLESDGRALIEQDIAPGFYASRLATGASLGDLETLARGVPILCVRVIPGGWEEACNYDVRTQMSGVVAHDPTPGSATFRLRFMDRAEIENWAWYRLPSLGRPVQAGDEAEVEDFMGPGQVFAQVTVSAPTLRVIGDAHVIARRTSLPPRCWNTSSSAGCTVRFGPERSELDAAFELTGFSAVVTVAMSVGTDARGQRTVGIDRVLDVLVGQQTSSADGSYTFANSFLTPAVDIDGDSVRLEGGDFGWIDDLKEALELNQALDWVFSRLVWDRLVRRIEDDAEQMPIDGASVASHIRDVIDRSLQTALAIPTSTVALDPATASVSFAPRALSIQGGGLLLDLQVTNRLVSASRETIDAVARVPFNLTSSSRVSSEASLTFGPELLAGIVRDLARGGAFSRTITVNLPSVGNVRLAVRPTTRAPVVRFQEDQGRGRLTITVELRTTFSGRGVRAEVVFDGTLNDPCSPGVDLVITGVRVPGPLVWEGARPAVDEAALRRQIEVGIAEAVLLPPILAAITGDNARRIPLLPASMRFASRDVWTGDIFSSATGATVELDARAPAEGRPYECRSPAARWAESLLPIDRIVRRIRGDIDPSPILIRDIRDRFNGLITSGIFNQVVRAPIQLTGGLMDAIVRYNPRGASETSTIAAAEGAIGAVRVRVPWEANIEVRPPLWPVIRYDGLRADVVVDYDAYSAEGEPVRNLRARDLRLENVSIGSTSGALLDTLANTLLSALRTGMQFMFPVE